jgi:hypothetical protein
VDRRMDGDTFDDLAEAVARGGIRGDGSLEHAPGELRERYAIELGSLESMLADLLGQAIVDAGSLRQARVKLRIPGELRRAWTRRAPLAGLDPTAAWLAAQPAPERRTLVFGIRVRRGDSYRDLAEAVGTVAAAGDGSLDPARLRRRYTIERSTWVRMVGDLLGQVVGDAGSLERGATVLAVPLDSLARWVRWFVARGSTSAASSRWPVALASDDLDPATYDDLAEAVERGAVDGDNGIDAPTLRYFYTVRLDSWSRMRADLLAQIVTDAGSVRQTAKALDVPRATLGAWMQRIRGREHGGQP